MTPCPLIFPLESFCFEDVTVHETSLGMSLYLKVYSINVISGNLCDFSACTNSAPVFAGKIHVIFCK